MSKTDDEDDFDDEEEDDGNRHAGDSDSYMDDMVGNEADEEEEGKERAAGAEHDAEVAQQARESMLATGIMNMGETMGCAVHEVVHALASCMASICNYAGSQITLHEQQTGTIFTHEQRLKHFVEEILEKIEVIEKEQAKNAERDDKASVRGGREAKRRTN